MDLPGWAWLLLIVVAIWATVVLGLFVAGRRVVARELATLLPNLARLFAGLLRDPRVPVGPKIALAVASVWIASPIDLIPEFIPVAGPLDDAIVAALVLRYVIRSTDPEVVRSHWPGNPRTLVRLLWLAGQRGGPGGQSSTPSNGAPTHPSGA